MKLMINFSLFSLEVLVFVLVIAGLLVLYLYIESAKEKDKFWERIIKIRGQHSLTEESFGFLRSPSWINKFYLGHLKDLLRETSTDTATRYRLRFEQAGWDSQDAPLIVSVVNIGLIILGFLLYLFLSIDIENIAQLPFFLKIFILALIMFASLRSFEYFMNFTIRKRYERIKGGFSYAIDLMSICTRSGFGLEKSFDKIAEEMSRYNKDLCKEFTKTAIELSIIPDRHTALRNLAQRVNIPVMQIFSSSLIQAEEQGASLSNTLLMMSVEFNKQKMLEIEATAAKLPSLLTLPIIMFLLPAMMIVLLGPAVSKLFTGGYFN